MDDMAIGDIPNYSSLLATIPDMWKHINKDEVQAQLIRDMAQANIGQNALAQQTSQAKSLQANSATLAIRARELFLKRMGGIRAEMQVDRDDFLQCHVYNDQVYVFYCFGGRNGVTVEHIDLFPSDQLITQFRLVLT